MYDYPTLITLKIYHGGVFTTCPGREYINGTYQYVDLVDTEEFSVQELRDMMKEIGIRDDASTVCHFKIPFKDLDFGLHALRNDLDVLDLLKYAPECKTIEVYTEVSQDLNSGMFLDLVDKNQEVGGFDLFDECNPFDETMGHQDNEVNEGSDSSEFILDDQNVLDDGVVNNDENEENNDHDDALLELEDFESNTDESDLEIKRFNYLKKLRKEKGI
ncbi:hypothetical protein L6452_38222 [Arctium lappa]|uniref:Uncharacterized protein n=1 Tax=Arctium lappa TaxID=4217 RepID=A0ACB8Y4C1_ARCLA|nr:hypothetical protein L6452_38222 [Arctium lappa]